MNVFKRSVVIVALLQIVVAQEYIDIETISGHSAELPCNVTADIEDDKLNILAWYRNDSATAFYSSRDLRDEEGAGGGSSGGASVSSGAKGRYRLMISEDEGINKLQILSVRPYDAGDYYCFADFAASPAQKTFVRLKVIDPPQRLWVIHENGTRVATAAAGSNASQNIGPYYVGDTVHLFCVAFGGNPLASLSWWAEQRLLKDTSTPLSEHRVRSDLQHGPLRREHHGLVLSCLARNNDHTPPLAIDVVVDMFLPPELVSVRDVTSYSESNAVSAGGRVRAGHALQLQCRVLGARPMPPVLWQINGDPLLGLEQNITTELSQRLVVSEIELTITQEHDETQVTCCAPSFMRNGPEFVCAQAMPLNVLYAPVLQINVDGDVDNNSLVVIKGSNVTLNCSYYAHPPVYQLIWFHEDDILTQDNDQRESIKQPILELTNVKESDAGEYVCAGSNDEGSTYSEPLVIDVNYPAHCLDETIMEYGIGEGESVNLTCVVKGNPTPYSYRWVFVNDATNSSLFRKSQPHTIEDTEGPTLLYQRPKDVGYNTIFCWGQNGVSELSNAPCTFLVTDETVPWPPSQCAAVKHEAGDVTVGCEKGYNGGLPQKFKLMVSAVDSEDALISVISVEPEFIIQEPKGYNYRLIIIATNDKGDSKPVEIDKVDIVDESAEREKKISAKIDIKTLVLALGGGVALIALAACGLVMCAHERSDRTANVKSEPPLCAYEESNCETFHDSDDSDCNVRRTESFKRAVSRCPSKYDVKRTSSFHSARYMQDMAEQEGAKCNDMLRHGGGCRVHSLQNISRKREIDAMCDHLTMQLPQNTNYQVPKPMNTFYTIPSKNKNKSQRHINDEASETTQSDGFSLPPPPDEYGTYRAATRIKDIPKTTPTYTTIRKPATDKDNVIISPMNTVGLPLISGTHNAVYSYPDDPQGLQRTGGVLKTFQSYSSREESGI